jgi:hypothetical protein
MDLKILKTVGITDVSEVSICPKIKINSPSNVSQYKQALHTANHSIEYERSHHIINQIIRDEDIRKLKCQILLLQDENDSLNDQLATEEENSDVLQLRLEYAENAVDELELLVQQFENDQRIRDREFDTAKVRASESNFPSLIQIGRTCCNVCSFSRLNKSPN